MRQFAEELRSEQHSQVQVVGKTETRISCPLPQVKPFVRELRKMRQRKTSRRLTDDVTNVAHKETICMPGNSDRSTHTVSYLLLCA